MIVAVGMTVAVGMIVAVGMTVAVVLEIRIRNWSAVFLKIGDFIGY